MNDSTANKVHRSCKSQLCFIILQHIWPAWPFSGISLKILMGGTHIYMYMDLQIMHTFIYGGRQKFPELLQKFI